MATYYLHIKPSTDVLSWTTSAIGVTDDLVLVMSSSTKVPAWDNSTGPSGDKQLAIESTTGVLRWAPP